MRNNSADLGGGLYVVDPIAPSNVAEISHSAVLGNTAMFGGGACVDEQISFSNSTVAGNGAGSNGAAVYLTVYGEMSTEQYCSVDVIDSTLMSALGRITNSASPSSDLESPQS